MMEFYPVLEKCSLFSGIDRENLPGMLSCLGARVRKVKKNQLILAEGEQIHDVAVVLSGSAQIIKEDFYGNRDILATVGPGELFGESFACAGTEKVPVSVVAVQDCDILLLDCRRITVSCSNACAFHNRIVINLLHVVAANNVRFSRKLEVLSKRTTREKLMTYLMQEAKKNALNSFSIPYDRQALADYLGVERSAMSAEISKLRREGILESKKNHFRLLREDGLCAPTQPAGRENL